MAFRPFAPQKAYKSLLVPINLANNIMCNNHNLFYFEFSSVMRLVERNDFDILDVI